MCNHGQATQEVIGPDTVFWVGSEVKSCQLCGNALGTHGQKTMFDSKLSRVGWGNWCNECHTHGGGRLGTGLGQQYRWTDGPHGQRWYKVAG